MNGLIIAMSTFMSILTTGMYGVSYKYIGNQDCFTSWIGYMSIVSVLCLMVSVFYKLSERKEINEES